jgi:hypothetical protein
VSEILFCDRSNRRLQSRGRKPLTHVRGGFCLPGSPQREVASRTMGNFFGLISKALGFLNKPLLKGFLALGMRALLLHGAALFPSVEGGSATGVLITDKSHVLSGDGANMYRQFQGASHLLTNCFEPNQAAVKAKWASI